MWRMAVKTLAVLAVVTLVGGAWWATRHRPDAAGGAPQAVQVEAPPPAAPPPMMPAGEAARPLPLIQVRGILLHQGNPTALLEIDHEPEAWYRIGEAVRPGLFITAIDRSQITLRDEAHNAYFEIHVHKDTR